MKRASEPSEGREFAEHEMPPPNEERVGQGSVTRQFRQGE